MRTSVGLVAVAFVTSLLCGCAVGTEGPDQQQEPTTSTRSVPDNGVIGVQKNMNVLQDVPSVESEAPILRGPSPAWDTKPPWAPPLHGPSQPGDPGPTQ